MTSNQPVTPLSAANSWATGQLAAVRLSQRMEPKCDKDNAYRTSKGHRKCLTCARGGGDL